MFSGTGRLIKLILRRDRVKLPVAIIGFVGSLLLMVPLLRNTYGDVESLQTLYATFGLNPAMLFLVGPMDGPTFGSMMTIETLLWWGIALALINTLLVVRHTRHNEEIGAQELIGSAQVGRAANLLAVVIVAGLMNLLIAGLLGAGLGIVEPAWAGESALLYGLAMGGFGLVWATIAAVITQIADTGRQANSLLVFMIGIMFILRGAGDFMGKVGTDGLHQPTWLSSLSPFGWLQAVRPLTFPDWSPLITMMIISFVLISVAIGLVNWRDVGVGLLLVRTGKSRASNWLKTPLGLTWYLQKNVFIGWMVGVLVMVVTIGGLVPQMRDMYTGSDNMRLVIEAIGGTTDLTVAFLSAMLAIIAIMIFGYAIQAIGRLRSEETNGYVENLLTTGLSRLKWLSLQIFVVLLGGGVMLVTAGGVMAVCVNLFSNLTINVLEYILAGLAYFPILAVFVGLYVLLFGVAPKLASLVIWSYYSYVAFVTWIGPMLGLDKIVIELSIMEHMAALPSEEVEAGKLVVFAMVSLVLLIIGGVAWRRRDTM